jgi:hypothetical protein
LLDIVPRSFENAQLVTEVITYHGEAKSLSLDRNNYNSVIKSCNAGGMTCFQAAFTQIQKVTEKSLKTQSFSQVVVVFMTDGNHTSE